MNSQAPILSVSHLNLWYGQQHALKSVGVEMHEKKVTALIGPSGCGKSTFLRCLNRLNDEIPGVNMKGMITLRGENIASREVDPVQLRRKVGMVFQRPNPFLSMSIYENVELGPRLNRTVPKSELPDLVEQSLRRAYLWDEVKDKLKKSAGFLSGGQQQRLCIARTIAVSPEVILLDEPTSALDPLATSAIEKLIVELRRDFTVVIVTHNMQQARRISDQVCFFHMGELIETAATDEFFTTPTAEKSKQYLQGQFG